MLGSMTPRTPRITLIGGPTVLLKYGESTFLTDPTFDSPGRYGHLVKTRGPALSATDVGPIDAVLLSHDEHADNLDRAGREILGHVPLVLSTASAAMRIPGVVGMEPGEMRRVGSVDVTAVHARHGPAAVVRLVGDVIGFVLRCSGWPTLYVTGDNASVRVAKRVLATHPDTSIIVLHAGAAGVERLGRALLTLNAKRAVAVAARARHAIVVPVHVDDWEHFREQRAEFLARFRALGAANPLFDLDPGIETEVRSL